MKSVEFFFVVKVNTTILLMHLYANNDAILTEAALVSVEICVL